MRDFFIRTLDKLISIFVVLGLIAVAIGALGALFAPGMGAPAGGGIVGFLLILIGGGLYIAFVAGFMFLGLGVYHNTRRTAEATEAMAKRVDPR